MSDRFTWPNRRTYTMIRMNNIVMHLVRHFGTGELEVCVRVWEPPRAALDPTHPVTGVELSCLVGKLGSHTFGHLFSAL